MQPHCPDSLTPMVRFFNGLAPDKLDTLGDVYSPGIDFRDPLHQVKGLPAVRDVFGQMFKQLGELTVKVTDAHGDERTGFILWEMRYRFRGAERVITGTSAAGNELATTPTRKIGTAAARMSASTSAPTPNQAAKPGRP